MHLTNGTELQSTLPNISEWQPRNWADSHNGRQCAERCTLHHIANKVYLFSMFSPTAHVLLPHFLQHYANLGVALKNNTRLVMDIIPDSQSNHIELCLQSIVSHGVPVSNVILAHNPDNSYWSMEKTAHINAYVKTLHRTAWLIYADIDEFFEYPCRIFGELGRTLAVLAHMADRVGDSLMNIPHIKSRPSLLTQFPRCVSIRAGIRKEMQDRKVILVSLRLGVDGEPPRWLSSHTINWMTSKEGWRNISDIGHFSHFAWSPDLRKSLEEKNTKMWAVRGKSSYSRAVYRRLLGMLSTENESAAGIRFASSLESTLQRMEIPCCPDGTRSLVLK